MQNFFKKKEKKMQNFKDLDIFIMWETNKSGLYFYILNAYTTHTS